MTNSIVEKLRKHLSKPVVSEADAMYLLVEVRKLLDRNKEKHGLFALSMYCHWAVHVDLTRLDTTKEFLSRIDRLIVNNVAGFTPDPQYTDSTSLFADLIFLDTFRAELKSLLQSHSLPTEICKNDTDWFEFLKAYAGIVEEGSLSIRNNNPLSAVSKVTFSKGGDPIAADALLDFVVQWDIELKDGRVCRTGFEAKPNRQIVVWNLHLLNHP